MKHAAPAWPAWLLFVAVSVGACITLRAHAGETVTALPATYELRNELSKPISSGHKTVEDCIKAAPVPAVGYLCIARVKFDKVGTCDDVPMPAMPTIIDESGALILPGIIVGEMPDGSWGPTMQEGFVRGEYPNCWVKGLVPYDGKFRAPWGPPIQEPGPWVESLDYPEGTPCPEEAHGNCLPVPWKTP